MKIINGWYKRWTVSINIEEIVIIMIQHGEDIKMEENEDIKTINKE